MGRHLGIWDNFFYDSISDVILEFLHTHIVQAVHEEDLQFDVYSNVFMGKEYNVSISNSEKSVIITFNNHLTFIYVLTLYLL